MDVVIPVSLTYLLQFNTINIPVMSNPAKAIDWLTNNISLSAVSMCALCDDWHIFIHEGTAYDFHIAHFELTSYHIGANQSLIV